MIILEGNGSLNTYRVSAIRKGYFTAMKFIFGERNLMSTGPAFSRFFLLKDIAGRGQLGGKGQRRAQQESDNKRG
ncbi:MAG: hypothetical protein FJ117_19630 [Deltaproteobacteria bacterium]|nr:hypothetical protein [Deltaproteobacteria bacterium]